MCKTYGPSLPQADCIQVCEIVRGLPCLQHVQSCVAFEKDCAFAALWISGLWTSPKFQVILIFPTWLFWCIASFCAAHLFCAFFGSYVCCFPSGPKNKPEVLMLPSKLWGSIIMDLAAQQAVQFLAQNRHSHNCINYFVTKIPNEPQANWQTHYKNEWTAGIFVDTYTYNHI